MIPLVVLFAAWSGCFVEGRCKTDEECDWPKVCNSSGACILECSRSEDCELEELCTLNRCVPAPGCIGCSFEHADHTCVHGDCQMGACHPGWVDVNQSTRDGCEYECTPTGAEVCDEADNDCDTLTDEGFNLATDPLNCGRCGYVCPTPDHAVPLCVRSECTYICQDGWYDTNGRPDDGCETEECIPTGPEVCDGVDNNCDGETDEGFDKTLPESCGPLCIVCEYDHAEPLCVDGGCQLGPCEEDWYNFNHNPEDGCEEYCLPTGPEVCDDIDNDCDGYTDEGLSCCPEGMVSIDDAFCIDIYEAHLELNEQDELMAVPEFNVMPFWDRSMTVAEAEGYCQAAGKRLCTPAEWQAVCIGPDRVPEDCMPTPQNPDAACYCYGTSYEPVTCNGIDTYGMGNQHLMPTGSFPDCTNDYGIFDICGNVWEMTSDGLVRGGAYNCIDSASLHECLYSIESYRVVAIGLRCCL